MTYTTLTGRLKPVTYLLTFYIHVSCSKALLHPQCVHALSPISPRTVAMCPPADYYKVRLWLGLARGGGGGGGGGGPFFACEDFERRVEHSLLA